MPLASLSLDLDNAWAYLMVEGHPRWREAPSYLPTLVPRMLDYLKARDVRLTVFVVGKDAEDPDHEEVMARLGESGHEIGNHSFHHDPRIHRKPLEGITAELDRASLAIEAATGHQPSGFRSPCYACSEALLRAVAGSGFSYDATLFPTFIGPLARAFYELHTRRRPEADDLRKELFGPLRAGLRPLRPFRWVWETDAKTKLSEVPVTTLPLFKLPIHTTYVMYLASHSEALARLYLALALKLCRLLDVSPSYLLHPLDFLGLGEAPELAFFPGMSLPLDRKRRVLDGVFDTLTSHFEPVTVGQHAAREATSSRMRRAALEKAP